MRMGIDPADRRMKMTKTLTHKSYNLVAMPSGGVDVFDPRWPTLPVHQSRDFASAKRWVNAFRRGEQWAVNAAC